MQIEPSNVIWNAHVTSNFVCIHPIAVKFQNGIRYQTHKWNRQQQTQRAILIVAFIIGGVS